MMKFFVMFFIIFFAVSCEDEVFCTLDIPTYEQAAVEKLNNYVKANIKPVDDSYSGETYDIDGKKYPINKIKEAPEKGFPEGIRRRCFTPTFHIDEG